MPSGYFLCSIPPGNPKGVPLGIKLRLGPVKKVRERVSIMRVDSLYRTRGEASLYIQNILSNTSFQQVQPPEIL